MNIAVLGHNELPLRLEILADAAKSGIAAVERGEGEAVGGWLAYGSALNEGRTLFHPENDKGFGGWVAKLHQQLVGVAPNDMERAAAMWAAANAEQFAEARAAGNARTVRGIHANWKELEAQREADKARSKADALRAEAIARAAAEAAAREAAQAATDEAARDEAEVLAQSEGQALAKAEALARMAEHDAVLAEKRAEGPRLKERILDWQTMPPAPHVAQNSGNNEWYTPAEFVEAAREVLGRFDLDPASSEIANRTVQAAQIFTEDDDGLQQDWPIGNIWMNPPYAQPLMGQFADKFAAEVRRGSNGIVLVNNATETAWFQTIAAECSAVCFPKGRIRFLDPEGNQGAPLQGQAIIYCGPAPENFARAFAGFGLVVLHE